MTWWLISRFRTKKVTEKHWACTFLRYMTKPIQLCQSGSGYKHQERNNIWYIWGIIFYLFNVLVNNLSAPKSVLTQYTKYVCLFDRGENYKNVYCWIVPLSMYKNSMLLSFSLFELGNAVLLVISKKEYIGDVMTSTHYSLLKSKGKMAGFQILFFDSWGQHGWNCCREKFWWSCVGCFKLWCGWLLL